MDQMRKRFEAKYPHMNLNKNQRGEYTNEATYQTWVLFLFGE